jgi:hypothetical protein
MEGCSAIWTPIVSPTSRWQAIPAAALGVFFWGFSPPPAFLKAKDFVGVSQSDYEGKLNLSRAFRSAERAAANRCDVP